MAPENSPNNFQVRSSDQYSNNLSSELWELCIGDGQRRTNIYRRIISDVLRENQCQRVLDAACGTGIDSIMLLEEGFDVTSIDLSSKMLNIAQEARWQRRREPAFDSWVIKKADWLRLKEDLEEEEEEEEDEENNSPFDAIICLGNSFPTLVGTLPQPQMHRITLGNMASMMKPGGILIIDHLNFDCVIDKQEDIVSHIYYESKGIKSDKTTLIYENGEPVCLKRDYVVDLRGVDVPQKYHRYHGKRWQVELFPHRLTQFQSLLKEVFSPVGKYEVLADYKPIDQVENPKFYVHIIQKSF